MSLTVSKLIEILQTYPEDMLVVCDLNNEYYLLQEEDIEIIEKYSLPDSYGHISLPISFKDKTLQQYLLLRV